MGCQSSPEFLTRPPWSWRIARRVVCVALLHMVVTMMQRSFDVPKIPFRNPKGSPVSSVIAEAREIIALAAGPRQWSDSMKVYINRGARVLGLSPGRATSIWYAKASDLRASEWVALQEKAAALRARLKEQEARNASTAAEILARRADDLARVEVGREVRRLGAPGAEAAGAGAAAVVSSKRE
jgi:hypothetical protein